MPLIKIFTNKPDREVPDDLMVKVTHLVAEVLNKPIDVSTSVIPFKIYKYIVIFETRSRIFLTCTGTICSK